MPQHNHVPSSVDDMDSPEIVGNRLFKIRIVAGFGARKQKAFADAMGFEEDSYSQWESGKILCPVFAAVVVCEYTENGVTLDYIYRGRLDFMGPGWALPLKSAPDRPSFVKRAAPRPTSPVKRSRR